MTSTIAAKTQPGLRFARTFYFYFVSNTGKLPAPHPTPNTCKKYCSIKASIACLIISIDIQRSKRNTGIHFTLMLHMETAFSRSWELLLRHNEPKHYKVQSALRPAQDALLSCFFQRWLNAQIFYHYEVLTSSIRVAINVFYHIIKPEITHMAMTFLYLQYTKGHRHSYLKKKLKQYKCSDWETWD